VDEKTVLVVLGPKRSVNEQLAINFGVGSPKFSQKNIYTGDVYMNTMPWMSIIFYGEIIPEKRRHFQVSRNDIWPKNAIQYVYG